MTPARSEVTGTIEISIAADGRYCIQLKFPEQHELGIRAYGTTMEDAFTTLAGLIARQARDSEASQTARDMLRLLTPG